MTISQIAMKIRFFLFPIGDAFNIKETVKSESLQIMDNDGRTRAFYGPPPPLRKSVFPNSLFHKNRLTPIWGDLFPSVLGFN
jgi:hypothetical protein